jgi:flavin-dependent dehydrogenase
MAARRDDAEAEVLIAGGGPAGAAAAIACAQRGLRVVVAERAAFTRERPGEALHPGVEPLFSQLGIGDRLSGVVGARHKGVWIRWGDALRFEPFGRDAKGPWQGFQVNRRALDSLLLERARELGVEVRQPCSVLEPVLAGGRIRGAMTTSGPVRCRIFMDATGSARWLTRKLKLAAASYSPPLHARFGYVTGSHPARDDAPALTGDADGWTWTARVAEDLYQWIRLDIRKQPSRSWLPDEFRGLAPLGPARGSDVTWRLSGAAAGSSWFIVGDAGAMLDPSSSHGILKAVMSGMMAAHLAAAALRNAVPIAEISAAYQAWLEGWFRTDASRLGDLYARLGIHGLGQASGLS